MEHQEKLDADDPSLSEVVKEAAVLPFRIFLSKPALKTYLSTILLISAGLAFYAIAACTYVYFYYNYIPNLSFTVPVHLQFDHIHHAEHASNVFSFDPYGISSLTKPGSSSSALVSQQKYDFSVSLTLPRTPGNVEAGNFMLDMTLLSPFTKQPLPHYLSKDNTKGFKTIAQSSRPTSLTYTSPLLDQAHKAMTLPLYLSGMKQEVETIHVPVMEGITFERGGDELPKALMVRLKSRSRLQTYACEVSIKAQLVGIRWLMYNYRILSFVVFTTLFWMVEMGTTLTIWLLAALILPFSSGTKKTAAPTPLLQSEREREADRQCVKDEEDDDVDTLSDTSRSFPTYSRQPPLHYSSGSQAVKQEEIEDGAGVVRDGAQADVSATDTDEDADFVLQEPEAMWQRERDFRDSGLGTSFESGSGSAGGLARRRSSGRGRRDK